MVPIEVPRPIVVTRPGTIPQEVRSRDIFEDTRAWREISKAVTNIMDKLSRKPSLLAEIPHLREALFKVLETVKEWQGREIIPSDKLYGEEWVYQILQSVLPYKEMMRLISSVDNIMANNVPTYRTVHHNALGAEFPLQNDGTINSQFDDQIDDRLAFMILSKRFPREIPVDHPDFNFTAEQKRFTGVQMTGRDLVMCTMNQRVGSYPQLAITEESQRISNLFLLVWGTIPGRLEATEIYHSGN